MDRQMVYVGAIPQDTDFLLTNKNVMLALGNALQMALGTTTQVDGLACAPTSPAGMTVNVAPGSITTQGVVDQNAYGSVAADTANSVVKQGIILTTTNFSCPAPGTVGQSVVYLVQAAFSEVDGGATVLPYYNASNPAAPYNGPGNAGTSNNTVRQGKCLLNLKAGVAATTGSQTTPAADAGYTPLYAITVANGQTTITSGSIATINGAPILLEKLKDKISQTTGDARYLQITQLNSWEATDTGTANAKAATLSPAPASYTAGMRVSLLIGTANTAATTVNFNSLGAKTVKKLNTSGALVDVASGDLPTGVLVDMEYDGTVFQIIGRLAPIAAVSLSNVAYGTTAGGTTAYTITTTPSFSSLSTGQVIFATINAVNTGAVTLNPNSIGVTTVIDAYGNALASGFFVLNKTYEMVYDGAALRVLGAVNPYTYAGTVGGTANAITLTPGQALGAYTTGQRFTFLVATTNTSGTVTVNVSGLGTKNIKKSTGGALTALAVGDLIAATFADIEYDGTQFILLNMQTYTQGSNIASIATLNLDAAEGDYVHVTGTTGITAITLAQGRESTVIFDGILTLTNGASLINLTAANITTAAGDKAVFRGEASGVVRMVDYTRANGKALTAPSFSVVRQVFSGSGTYTPTAGMVYCDAEIVGAGGGGGGNGASGTGAGAGGGAGAYVKKVMTAAAIGGSQTITLGTGGTAGANTGGTGGTGGDSTFGAILTAHGGVGGLGDNGTQAVRGGIGGTGTGGDINIQGAPGINGGSGSSSSSGGVGGSTIFGPGGRGTTTNATGAGEVGINGGGGGGGAGASQLGGVGGGGYCVVTEYVFG